MRVPARKHVYVYVPERVRKRMRMCTCACSAWCGVVCIIIFNQSVKKLIISMINMTEKEQELSPVSWPLNLRQAEQNTITRSNN